MRLSRRRLTSTLVTFGATLGMTLGGTILAATSASAVGTETTSGFATGNVTAQRAENSPYKLKFEAGGTPTKAHGTFTYTEPFGYTVSGKVTCYHQEGNRAVFTGPVTKEANPDNNTESFVIFVEDNGGSDVFYVAGGVLLGPICGEFTFDLFDDEENRDSLYKVTSGNIVVGDENAQ
jgi:hypothetical protein